MKGDSLLDQPLLKDKKVYVFPKGNRFTTRGPAKTLFVSVGYFSSKGNMVGLDSVVLVEHSLVYYIRSSVVSEKFEDSRIVVFLPVVLNFDWNFRRNCT